MRNPVVLVLELIDNWQLRKDKKNQAAAKQSDFARMRTEVILRVRTYVYTYVINSLPFHITSIVNTCRGCGWVQSLKFGTAMAHMYRHTSSLSTCTDTPLH